jgi:hypothetical protein
VVEVADQQTFLTGVDTIINERGETVARPPADLRLRYGLWTQADGMPIASRFV